LREELQEEDEILVVSPDLPAMHGSDALGQQFEGIRAPEDTPRPASKCSMTIPGRKPNHHDRRCFRTSFRQALQDPIARHLPILQVSVNQGKRLVGAFPVWRIVSVESLETPTILMSCLPRASSAASRWALMKSASATTTLTHPLERSDKWPITS